MTKKRLTRADRVHQQTEVLTALDLEIAPLLKDGKVRAAIRTVAATALGGLVGAALRSDDIEDRVAALEAAAKPRVRVSAPSRQRQ